MTTQRSDSLRGSLAWLGLLVVVSALMVSAVHLAVLAFDRARGQLVFTDTFVLWVAPIANVLLIGVPLLTLFALAVRWPRLRQRRFLAFPAIFLTVFGILVLSNRVHWVAWAFLAVGIASRACLLAESRARAFDRAMQLLIAGSSLVIAVAAFVFVSTGPRDERDRFEAVDSAAPNVLLIILDTVRSESLSLYGYDRPTFDAVAAWATSGVVFDRAIAPSSTTLHSHASMFTGRRPDRLSTGWTSALDDTYPTLAETLRKQGYRTGGFVANVEYCSAETGLSRGFDHYEDYRVTPAVFLASSTLGNFLFSKAASLINDRTNLHRSLGYLDMPGRKSAGVIVDDLLDWIEADSSPFFAFINLYDAHAPYLPPADVATEFATRVGADGHYAAAVDSLNDRYDGGIAYIDRHLDRLFGELERSGRLENTLVVISSDHGEEFLEHGLVGHGYGLYWRTLHVPLIIMFGDRLGDGARVDETVSTTDIPATMLDLLGVSDSDIAGRSLAPLWTDGSEREPRRAFSELRYAWNHPDWYPISKGDMHSLVSGSLHLIRTGDGAVELYDVETDPLETRNMSKAHEMSLDLQGILAGVVGAGREPR